jgi:acetyl esterase
MSSNTLENRTKASLGRQAFIEVEPGAKRHVIDTTDPAKRKEIYASPLQASAEQLKGLPPTLIQVAENDILRNEGEAYGRALDEAGVHVTTVRYNGIIHDFGLLNGLAEIPQTRSLFMHP